MNSISEAETQEKKKEGNADPSMVLSEKFNLMEVQKDRIEQLEENKLGNRTHTGLLYGMPIVIRFIGKNVETVQQIVSDLSKYNHPSLALNYGYMLDKNSEGEEEVYVIRELIKGKNFFAAKGYTLHDQLVILYKTICIIEFLHSFNIYFKNLRPDKIIITDDVEIKLVDNIKNDDEFFGALKDQLILTKDSYRYICPELYEIKDKITDHEKLKKFDLYSLGCLMFFSVTGKNPWEGYNAKKDIINAYNQSPAAFFIIEKENITTTDKKLASIIERCLTNQFDDVNKLREEFGKFPQVILYLKDDVLEFDFKKETENVIRNINELVDEIDKLFDSNANIDKK